MTRGDVELLMLGRERMMSFIGGPGADQLGIHSWVPFDNHYSGHLCINESCQYLPCRGGMVRNSARCYALWGQKADSTLWGKEKRRRT